MIFKILFLQLLIFTFPFFSLAQSNSLSVISEFNTPSNNPWGLTFDGENLWLSDDSNSSIYKINVNGNVLDSIYISNCKVKGITFENESLWIVNDNVVGDTTLYWDKPYVFPLYQIYKINKDSGAKLDSIKFRGSSTNYTQLWGITFYNDKFGVSYNGGWGPCIYEIDPIQKEVDYLCCAHPCGMTVINDTVWCVRMNSTDGPGNSIVPLEIKNGGSRELREFRYEINFYASDIAYDGGENIWLCDRYSNKLKKMQKPITFVEHEISSEIPTYAKLYQNYPNPFNIKTKISFKLQQSDYGSLSIFNIQGQLIKNLITNKYLYQDKHFINWNGQDNNGKEVQSGVYFYKLQVGNHFVEIKKMVFIR